MGMLTEKFRGMSTQVSQHARHLPLTTLILHVYSVQTSKQSCRSSVTWREYSPSIQHKNPP